MTTKADLKFKTFITSHSLKSNLKSSLPLVLSQQLWAVIRIGSNSNKQKEIKILNPNSILNLCQHPTATSFRTLSILQAAKKKSNIQHNNSQQPTKNLKPTKRTNLTMCLNINQRLKMLHMNINHLNKNSVNAITEHLILYNRITSLELKF